MSSADDDLVLPSIYRVAEAARRAVTAAHDQAARFAAERFGLDEVPAVAVGTREAAIAFRSERYLRVDGEPAFDWGPLSGDYLTADGWIRLHCNFDHHAAAVCRVLGVPADREAVTRAVGRRERFELEAAVTEAGGAAAAMRTAGEWSGHPQARAVGATLAEQIIEPEGSEDSRLAAPGLRPLAGIRVLDLTRIIAGPVAGRVLASYGADVTLVRAPHLPTIRGLDLDLAAGKALRFLDLCTDLGRGAFLDLVRAADVVLQSYRPGALAGLGLGAADLQAVNPGLVHVSVSAYGPTGPWAGRRGFDSLVQMATGIADAGMRASGGDRPVPLPAQVLDHAAGWFAAAGTVRALRRGGGEVAVSLAGMAHWLAGLGRLDPAVGLAVADPGLGDIADLVFHTPAPAGDLTQVRAPGTIAGRRPAWSGPTPFS